MPRHPPGAVVVHAAHAAVAHAAVLGTGRPIRLTATAQRPLIRVLGGGGRNGAALGVGPPPHSSSPPPPHSSSPQGLTRSVGCRSEKSMAVPGRGTTPGGWGECLLYWDPHINK